MRRRIKWILLCVLLLAVALFAAFCLLHDSEMLLDVSHANKPPATTRVRETYAEVAERSFLPDDGTVRPVGRTMFDGTTRWFSMSGCGIEFSCVADWADITLTVASSYAVAYNHRPRVAVLVNGTPAADEILDEAETTIHLSLSDLSGETVIKVIKLSESMYSCVGVTDITVHSNAGVTPTPQPDMLVEFIGDSITAGYGLDAQSVYESFSTRTENYLETFAYLTAQSLGAESYAVAFSGYGVLTAFTNNGVIRPDLVLSKRYGKTLTNLILSEGQSDDWDFVKPKPTMIIINLGTNDASYCYTADRRAAFVRAYVELLRQVRDVNADVPIICVLGDMNASLMPSIEQAVEDYRLETGDRLVTSTPLSFQMETLGSTIDGHPNRDSNKLAAETLTNFLWQTSLGTSY